MGTNKFITEREMLLLQGIATLGAQYSFQLDSLVATARKVLLATEDQEPLIEGLVYGDTSVQELLADLGFTVLKEAPDLKGKEVPKDWEIITDEMGAPGKVLIRNINSGQIKWV